MSSEEKVILAIRVRGRVRVRPQIEMTLDKLSLIKLHHAKVYKTTPSVQGMIIKSKDYITWGEVDEDTLVKLLVKRGRVTGGKQLTDAYIKKNSSFASIKALAKAVIAGEASFKDVEGLKPIFRLTPPTKGYRGKTYWSVGMGGVTGYRGENINELAQKML
ncbi:MAG: 50S ribosomal protein L30 [Candidatus Thorarchaeota archaeon]|nr:50S ribosomal protein L30 [Candidatus Thorarchaeota archaeon]